MTIRDGFDIDHEVEMIGKLDIWPMFPILPMKYVGTDKELRWAVGFIRADMDKPLPTVYHANLLAIPKGTPYSDIPSTTYETVRDMVADGWIGD